MSFFVSSTSCELRDEARVVLLPSVRGRPLLIAPVLVFLLRFRLLVKPHDELAQLLDDRLKSVCRSTHRQLVLRRCERQRLLRRRVVLAGLSGQGLAGS